MKTGVLIVAYNARDTVTKVLDRIPPAFADGLAEILVLDDHSSDDTTVVTERYRDDHPDLPITVFRQPRNLGYGGNQKSGYRYALDHGWDVVVMVHGDGQYAPELLPDMVAPFADESVAAVFGSRMMRPSGAGPRERTALHGGMPLYKYAGNRILTTVQNRLTGAALTEWHSGFRAYRTSALADLDLDANSDGFDFDTEIILQLLAAEQTMAEIAIPTHYGEEICHVNGLAYARDIMVHTMRFRLENRGFGRGQLGRVEAHYSYKLSAESSHGRVLSMMEGRPPCRVLDVGCGPGWLAGELRDRGHHVVGVDLVEHPDVRTRTDQFIRADLDAGLPQEAQGAYDVVIAADVVEHVRDSERLMRQMSDCLRPSGRMLTSVPNISHWYSRGRITLGLFNYDQRGILDRTHLRFFTRRSFLQLTKHCHLVPVRAQHTGLPFDVLTPGDGGVLVRILGRIDRLLVRIRPTLFAYQFVYELAPARRSISSPTE